MREIAVVTTARSDYGIWLPVLRALREREDVRLRLLVAGMHLSPEFGRTVDAIAADGFATDERIEMLLSSDSAEGVAKSMGVGMLGFAQALGRARPDLLMVLGDRFETLSAVAAALPFALPVAHLHGGETTEGAVDESIRHAVTKMSHLHFVATEAYRDRVVRMGEEPWRVTVSGAPGLDNLRATEPLPGAELAARIGLPLDPAPLLVTFHPETLDPEGTARHAEAMLEAIAASGRPAVFTAPNADAGGRALLERIERYVAERPEARLVANLGTRAYFSLMSRAAAMVGNSSSGIIEAASFGLPVVNVGDRQAGRVRGRNVIDAAAGRGEVAAALRRALDPAFRASLAGMENPYGDGRAAERIVARVTEVPLDRRLIVKRFHDLPGAP